MKKQITILIVGLAFFVNVLNAQSVITLEECHRKAVDNYPLIKQYGLISLAEKYSLDNVAKSYLPQFSLNGQATYQSEVTRVPIDLSSLPVPMGIPSMSKDQYKATIDASQLIWDGGINSSQNKITKATSEVEKQKVEVSLHSIKEKVNQLYFGVLSINEQLKILELTEKNILSNKEVAQSMFNNGITMQSDLDQIEVELLRIEQNCIEQQSLKEAYLKMLSLFIHQQLNSDTSLQSPDEYKLLPDNISRSELSLYDAQIRQLNTQENIINAKNMPQIRMFAQGGYGRPGLNMLEDRFKFYAIGGVKMTWNFGNLYTRKNEKKLITNSVNNIEILRETFLFNTSIELTKEQSEIQKTRKMLEKDDEIIRLRNRVKIASESKYRNGTYQVNELIRDINAESLARQTKALREIEYLLNIHQYKHIQGE